MASNLATENTAPLSGVENDLVTTMRVLSEQIGPREAGSENERLAAAYCVDRLRKAGYDVTLEPFQSLKTFSWTYAPLYALGAAAGLLSRRSPKVSAALGASGLGLLLAEIHGVRLFSRLPLPRGRSQNIVARIKLPDDSAGEPESRVIITAHLDSQRAALFFEPRLVRYFRDGFLLSLASMTAITLSSVSMSLRRRQHTGWPGRLVTALGAFLLAPVAILLHRELALPVTPGASSDAAGVAVLMAAADRLIRLRSGDKSRLAPSEVWIVLTGGSTAGLEGMQQFLQQHGAEFDKRSTTFINVENIASGDLTLISEEGMFWSHSADARLLEEGMAVALRRGIPIRVRPFHTLLTDAQVPLSRGLRAVTIMAVGESALPSDWNWTSDTWDKIDHTALSSVLELVTRLARRQVRRPGGRIVSTNPIPETQTDN